MKKLLSIFLISTFFVTNLYATNQWREDGSEATVLGTEVVSDIDAATNQNMTVPLDRMLSKYRSGYEIQYASASTLTVTIGEAMVQNSGGTARLMLANTSAISVSWSDIDTGAEAVSTTYYVWLTVTATSDLTGIIKISASSTAPSGSTYYTLLGSFFNNSAGDITAIVNERSGFASKTYDSGWFAVATGTAYSKTHSLGSTNSIFVCYLASDSSGSDMTIPVVLGPDGSGEDGYIFDDITPTAICVRTGATSVGRYYTGACAASGATRASSGFYRIVGLTLD